MTTPKVGAPELVESQADKEETANEAFRMIEAGSGLYRPESQVATSPPGSCADGAQYIVAASATGAWSGQDGKIAIATGANASNGWKFIAPEEGLRAWVKDEGAEFAYDGSAWSAYTAATTGAVTTTGSPSSGNLAKFSGASSVTNGDLTGDVTTSGGLATSYAGVVPANKGGAGTVSGLLKANGSGTVSAAVSSTDYAPATSGSAILYGNGSGGFSSVTIGSNLTFSGGTLSASSGGSSSIGVNAQTGTTYTLVSGDLGKLVTFNNTASIVATLPSGATSGAGWYAYIQATGLAAGNTLRITSSSTVGGNTSYYLGAGTVLVISDGTNYLVIPQTAFYGGSSSGGGLSLSPQDGSNGGNTRGQYAVDLQLYRSANTKVASGNYSFQAGYDNVASALYAFAIGSGNTSSAQNTVALGASNTASTQYAVAIGRSNTVTGSQAVAIGDTLTSDQQFACVLGHGMSSYGYADYVWGQNAGGWIGGERQTMLYNQTSGATAVRLTADTGAAGSANVANIPTSTAFAFQVEIIIYNIGTGGKQVFTFGMSLLSRDGGGTTTLSAGTLTVGPALGTAFTLQANPSLTVDTTNGGINISYTPPAGNSSAFRSSARVFGTISK